MVEMNFQSVVLISAISLLIVSLVAISYMLKRNALSQTWPPVVGTCPDYWKVDGNNCVPNGINTGNTGASQFDYTISDYQGSNGICNLNKWAVNAGVVWDGVTIDGGGKPVGC
jgi:hypothetical protein